MVKCEECSKKLGILEGYRHPIFGKKYLLCSKCFDIVSEFVEKWAEFVLSDSFNNASSKKSFQFDGEKIFTEFKQFQKKFGKVQIKGRS